MWNDAFQWHHVSERLLPQLASGEGRGLLLSGKTDSGIHCKGAPDWCLLIFQDTGISNSE